MKSEKSLRSIKSTRSLRTSRAAETRRNDFIDFENVLPMACAKFDCSYAVLVKKSTRNDEYFRYLKYTDIARKRISLMPQVVKPEPAPPPPVPASVQPSDDDASVSATTTMTSTVINTLTVNSIYDNYNSLAEIRLENLAAVPRILLQIIAFLVPFYKNVTKIAITNSKINGLSVYELGRIIQVSTITQLSLDGSPVPEANYEILLETDNLRHLSLSRCDIDDEFCKQIATKLHMSGSAQHLSLLNLSCNRITDIGARFIAEFLRTNRHLRYLNLADNEISDDGAYLILGVLKEFPLTCDEIIRKRQRYFKYLKQKQVLYYKFFAETSGDDRNQKFARRSRRTSLTSSKGRPSSARRDKDRQSNAPLFDESLRAEMLAKQALGPFIDPFQPDCIKSKDGHIFCLGNMALCYLNLSYNHLSYASIKTLCQVVSYQRNARKPPQTGLIRIVVDGNNIPIKCPEMLYISDMLNRIYHEAMRLKRQSIIR